MSIKSWFDSLNIWIKIILIIVMVILSPIGTIFLTVYLISWALNSKKNYTAIQKLENYIGQKGKLKEAKTRLILQKDEKILYYQMSDFYEERAVRNYVRSGHSIKIMENWWYHIGTGQAESHGELRRIDSGILYITNKRFIFNGNFKNCNYKYNKILSIEPFGYSIRIAVEGRQKTLSFTTNKPFLLGASLEILSKNNRLEKEAKEYLESELKQKIAEKIKLIEGDLIFNAETYGDMSRVFKLLGECIEIDIQDYTRLLQKIPSEIINLKLKVESFSKILENYQKELNKIKIKLGNSIKKEELQNEFNRVVDKKYGEHILSDYMEAISKTMNNLGTGKMMVSLKVKNK